MNGRGGLQQPRHPSLDNLRRPLNTRSYPNLPSVYDNNGNGGAPNGGATEEEAPPDSILQLAAGLFCAAAAFWCFIGLLLLLGILYMTVRPFSKSFYRRLAATLGAASFLDAISLLLPNRTLVVTGDSDVPSPVGTSLLVCNQWGDGTDWWSIFMLGRSVGLRGSLKVFLRNECLGLHPQKNPKTSHASSAALVHQAAADDKTVTFNTPGRRGSGTTAAPAATNGNSHQNGNHHTGRKATLWVSLCAQMLHTLLDFPVLSNENQYIEERQDLFSLLKSFAETNAETPVHLLLFPEGWSLMNGCTDDPKAVLAKSLDFAIREGRPQLKHLLLPRTTGFNASLESLRESNPVVYDVTIAVATPPRSAEREISLTSLWNILRQPAPEEVHMRIKRYSMEEVLQDASWLDKQWAEKDRLLTQFARHGCFPSNDSRIRVLRPRVFSTRTYAVESSVLALLRLLILPTFCPILLLLSIPLFWSVLWLWILYKSFQILTGQQQQEQGGANSGGGGMRGVPTPNSSRSGTPFVPTTPFGSPSLSNWRDMIGNNNNRN